MSDKIKLHLGCGDEILPDYINCDIENPKADMLFDATKIPFPDNSVDEIRAYHLIEHFVFQNVFDILKEWLRALKPNGILVLETPDFLNSCKRFVETDDLERLDLYGHFFSQPHLSPQMVHYFLYTENQLKWVLERVGFTKIERVPADSHHVEKRPYWQDLYLKIIAYKPE